VGVEYFGPKKKKKSNKIRFGGVLGWLRVLLQKNIVTETTSIMIISLQKKKSDQF
jgi:hypothetical protein